ncbi:MAG: nicotinate phosphoribosyltransferase [Desulfobacteraceae bacterium]|nr:MAG: nicotinate phosphoribosyltransferase [Desulfobacteraceae bacterium]
MIQSILDNDLYKFSMQQAVHTLYPRAEVQYTFINRSNTRFPRGFANLVQTEVQNMSGLRLHPEQKTFLKKRCYFLTPVYLDFLETYQYDPAEVSIHQEGHDLSLHIKGPWYRTILWEVPLMAIISEAYFKATSQNGVSVAERRRTNREKARILSENGVKFADFGTRRRFSASNHDQVIQDLLDIENPTLIGTSNVHLALKYNLVPIGTLAHEWFMFHSVLHGYQMANPAAQDAWVRVFHGDLGIALTDTYTTDVFLSTFDTFYAKLFDGVRQDSGDPIEFTDKLVAHYRERHIDPKSKTIVFSDGLNVDKAVRIHEYCQGKVRDAYGIGTNLTNDVGVSPLNMVIKLTRCRPATDKPWRHTVKLSDDQGKHTGDPKELENCMNLFYIKKLPG